MKFKRGKYAFYADDAQPTELYISNHDQGQPKRVAILLKAWKNLTFDGNGSEFLCYGRMLPVALISTENCTLQNFSIGFPQPQIAQVKIVENRGEKGIVFTPTPWSAGEGITKDILRIMAKAGVLPHRQALPLTPSQGISYLIPVT